MESNTDATSSNEEFVFPRFDFDSELASSVVELERLRGEIGVGTTPPHVFSELHGLFQFLSSMISARIEGNRTTILDAIAGAQAAESQPDRVDETVREILNLNEVMEFIDESDPTRPITHSLIREFHRRAVDGLVREGDSRPGAYRVRDVAIQGATHQPPLFASVQAEMDRLLEFVNRQVPTHQQLLHVAIAHHRFLWVHPFQNGNGRVSRLLSYAMLGRHGFVSPVGLRAVNPTSVFGVSRSEYYDALAKADDLSDAGTIAWCEFFISGLLADLRRLHRLQDAAFVRDELVAPALERFTRAAGITARERDILLLAFDTGFLKAGQIEHLVPGSPSLRSHALRPLLDRGLLKPEHVGGRSYLVSFGPNELSPFLIRELDRAGFLPPLLKDPA
ncbi:Fic family protein [Agromyces larvae]|uniref:Fic family protein n=1 Tax=Agromyces larvae TaxID=2929802 RepID=A0ABY4BY38_9MICO|nr:Fic family protein [Agromyces larvae]UOE44153.1 Fic family protein [Agromyces larvae]